MILLCRCDDKLDRIITRLDTITERIKHMASQADIDALTEQVNSLGGTLTTAVAGIQSDLDALKAANPAVDVSALQASVSALSGVVDSATALDAENPSA